MLVRLTKGFGDCHLLEYGNDGDHGQPHAQIRQDGVECHQLEFRIGRVGRIGYGSLETKRRQMKGRHPRFDFA